MVFSVPMRTGLGYRYYRSRSQSVPVHNHVAPWGQLGMPFEDALPRLPPDAVCVGQGRQARGVIALGDIPGGQAVKWGAIAVCATLALWAILHKGPW